MIAVKRTLKRRKLQRLALMCVQRNLRKWFLLKDCQWYDLFGRLRPNLNCVKAADEMLKAAEELGKKKKDLELVESTKAELEKQQAALLQAKNEMEEKLLAAQEMHRNAGEAIAKLEAQRKDLETKYAKCEDDKAAKDGQIATLEEEFTRQEELITKLQKDKKELEEQKKDTEENLAEQ